MKEFVLFLVVCLGAGYLYGQHEEELKRALKAEVEARRQLELLYKGKQPNPKEHRPIDREIPNKRRPEPVASRQETPVYIQYTGSCQSMEGPTRRRNFLHRR